MPDHRPQTTDRRQASVGCQPQDVRLQAPHWQGSGAGRGQTSDVRDQKPAGRHRLAAVLLTSVICLLTSGSLVGALVRAEELKIGYVNLAEVFDGYQRTKASDAALEKRGKEKEVELEGRMNELKKLRQSLELLSDDAREARARDIEERAEELQRFRTATARDLRRERDRAAKEILQEIQQTIEQYAKANAFSVVLDERSLLYGETARDLTQEVLKQLNNRASTAASR